MTMKNVVFAIIGWYVFMIIMGLSLSWILTGSFTFISLSYYFDINQPLTRASIFLSVVIGGFIGLASSESDKKKEVKQ